MCESSNCSSTVTWSPRRLTCHAAAAPITPPPTITTSRGAMAPRLRRGLRREVTSPRPKRGPGRVARRVVGRCDGSGPRSSRRRADLSDRPRRTHRASRAPPPSRPPRAGAVSTCGWGCRRPPRPTVPSNAATAKQAAGSGTTGLPTTASVSSPVEANGKEDPRPHATWIAAIPTSAPAVSRAGTFTDPRRQPALRVMPARANRGSRTCSPSCGSPRRSSRRRTSPHRGARPRWSPSRRPRGCRTPCRTAPGSACTPR